jgi:hypothetical protein
MEPEDFKKRLTGEEFYDRVDYKWNKTEGDFDQNYIERKNNGEKN